MAETILFQVKLKQNNPFGTFVTGDVIQTYWDDTASTFKTYLNYVTSTSGSPIGIAPMVLSGTTWDDYYTGKIYQLQVCNGSSLLKFMRSYVYPYMTISSTLTNHPSCDIFAIHNVCDCAFTAIPVVSNCSTATTADGTITVTATSSYGSVKYRLNGDLEYEGSTGQTSGVFTGLLPGDYLIYCRDVYNCLAVISASVGISYSYGTKYQLEFYSLNGYHVKAEILEREFVDALEEICGTGSPLSLSKRGEGDIDKMLTRISTECVFNLMSETEGQFEDLFTNDFDKYRIRVSVDDGGGYDIIWVGKMLPNQYREQYSAAPYPISLVATDGLGELNNFLFLDPQGNRILGEFKQIELIAYILGKINLGITIRSFCNIYADGMNTTDADDPLDQTYVDTLTYYIENETPKCTDVLSWLLEPYGAHIVQWNNCWNIVRMEEMQNATMAYREYSSIGIYSSNGTISPSKVIDSADTPDVLHWKDADSSQMSLQPGFGGIQLQYILGQKKNLFVNGDFRQRRYSIYDTTAQTPELGIDTDIRIEVLPDTTGFQIVNNDTTITKGVETIADDNAALILTSNEAGGFIISEPLVIKMGISNQLKFTFEYKIQPTLYGEKVAYIKVKIRVKYGGSYLLEDGSWSTSQSIITIYVSPKDFGKYLKFEVVGGIPASVDIIGGEQLDVKFYIPHPYDPEYIVQAELEGKTTVDLPDGWLTELLVANTLCYYMLFQTKADEDTDTPILDPFPSIIRPNDYHATTNPYQWMLMSKVLASSLQSTGSNCSIYIDKIVFEIMSNGRLLPDSETLVRAMENKNKLLLNKILHHGSLIENGYLVFDPGNLYLPGLKFIGDRLVSVSVVQGKNYGAGRIHYNNTTANLMFTGYLRDSTGTGYVNWGRDALSGESLPIELVYMNMYRVQYKSHWRKIIGSVTTHDDIFLGFLDSVNDLTLSQDRNYFPVSLSIDLKKWTFDGEFLEIFDPIDGVGFTTGFTLGYDA